MIEKASVGDDANDSLVLLPCNDNSVDGNMKELSNGDVVYDKVAEEGQPIRPGILCLYNINKYGALYMCCTARSHEWMKLNFQFLVKLW